VADSQFCIEYLKEKKGIDLSSELTAEQKAIERATRVMLEDNMYYVCQALVMVHGKGKDLKPDFPIFAPKLVQNIIYAAIVRGQIKSNKKQGMGRHSKEEVEKIGCDNLNALSALLGEKQFFFGTASPTLLDIVSFAFLAAFMTGNMSKSRGTVFTSYVEERCPNLTRHFKFMKSTYWPDWDDQTYDKVRQRPSSSNKVANRDDAWS